MRAHLGIGGDGVKPIKRSVSARRVKAGGRRTSYNIARRRTSGIGVVASNRCTRDSVALYAGCIGGIGTPRARIGAVAVRGVTLSRRASYALQVGVAAA